VTPGFWRGLCFGLPMSLLIWAAIFLLVFTGWHV